MLTPPTPRRLGRSPEQGHVRRSSSGSRSARALRERLTKLWNYERFGAPFRKRRAVLLLQERRSAEPGGPVPAADAGRLAHACCSTPTRCPRTARSRCRRSSCREDGRFLAYALAASGSDWNEVKVREVATGKDQGDHLRWIKFSGLSWSHDGAGSSTRAIRSRTGDSLTGVNHFHKLYYHALGTDQSRDRARLRAAGPARLGLGRHASPTTGAISF